MGKLFSIIVFIVVALLIISGVFTLLGALFSLTFGIIGGIMSLIWRILFSPLGLIIIIGYVIYRSTRKA